MNSLFPSFLSPCVGNDVNMTFREKNEAIRRGGLGEEEEKKMTQ